MQVLTKRQRGSIEARTKLKTLEREGRRLQLWAESMEVDLEADLPIEMPGALREHAQPTTSQQMRTSLASRSV